MRLKIIKILLCSYCVVDRIKAFAVKKLFYVFVSVCGLSEECLHIKKCHQKFTSPEKPVMELSICQERYQYKTFCRCFEVTENIR